MAIKKRLRADTRLRKFARRAGWHVAPTSSFDLSPRSYYSPLVSLDTLPVSAWARASSMSGINFDVPAQFAWAERHLADYISEFKAPAYGDPTKPRFYLTNRSFQTGDAEILHAMIRHTKPQRIIELGSGFSTLVMADAVLANHRDGVETQLVAYNPYPRPNIAGHTIPGLAALELTPAQIIPLDTFACLEAGDVLFVDTTHTVKLGSEVNRIILEILPTLRTGVLVHFHDIWLPHEYSRELIEDVGHAWAEQYLLQAFLAFNTRFQVLLGLHAMREHDFVRFRRLVPSFQPSDYPTGFWLVAT